MILNWGRTRIVDANRRARIAGDALPRSRQQIGWCAMSRLHAVGSVVVLVAVAIFTALGFSGESAARDGYTIEITKVAGATQIQEPDGEELFEESCSSCHGIDGTGTENGPSLESVGEASADFQLRTGRMPLAGGDEAVRKDPAFEDDEIAALVEYVGTLGDGPDIPIVDTEGANLAAGQSLFIDNCAACHGATGAGGAVGNEALAPSLSAASEIEIAEAVIVGPGQMPQFDFTEEQLNELVRFVTYLREEPRPGGADIGGIGPVPEGFVAWIVGMGSLVLVCLFIGYRRRPAGTRSDGEDSP
jgi:ubiquinol-cytochrome c reductase cytochrome c subunit